jgi:hypothetical protein
MRRIHPLFLIILFVVLLVTGIAWKIIGIDECIDRGGAAIAPMTRSQDCVDP